MQAAAVCNPGGSAPILLVCEHASRFIPPEYGNLGLETQALSSHIAFDLGAAEVARAISAELDAPLVEGAISRLILDCNRTLDAPDLIPERSERFEIPGNKGLTSAERNRRIENVHEPFHRTVEETLASIESVRCIATIHSFTPVYNGQARTVELGVLHDADSRLANRVLELANDFIPLQTMRNQPYGSGDGVLYTLRRHAVERGIPNVMLEVRNDLIAAPEDQQRIGKALASIISEAADRLESAQSAEMRE